MRTLLLSLAFAPLLASAQALSGTFVVSNYGGSNISCRGGNNGSIDLTPTGGTPPYTYDWSNNATTQDLSGLTAGYYKVKIRDAANNVKDVQTTLTEPTTLSAFATLYEYGNGYNISLFNAYNGSISVTRSGGKTPYTQVWNDGNTQQSRTGLDAGNYSFTITDANGCVFVSSTYQLTQPDRADWTMGGNAGTNPTTQFIGTTDNKDVVFKSNAQERLRLKANGEVKLAGLASTDCQLLYVTADGLLKRADDPGLPICTGRPWLLGGNNDVDNQTNRLGTNDAFDLIVVTDADERMRVTVDGKVGIGTAPPTGTSDYLLFVENGISTRDVLVKVGAWPDYVFDPRYQLMPLDQLRTFLATNRHLPGLPSAAEVEKKSGIEVGDLVTRLLKANEEQALYILQLEEQQRQFEQRLSALEASHQ